MIKRASKVLAGVAAIGSLSFFTPSHFDAAGIPTAHVIATGKQLELQGSIGRMGDAVFAQILEN